jgi:hypothetical protein
MKQVIRLASVVAALMLCAASASSLNGGAYPGPAYHDTDLGGGEYMVRVSGASKHRAREIAFGRAAEVCGSGGFDVIGGDIDARENYVATTTGGEYARTTTVSDATTYDVSVVYQCRSGSGQLGQRQYAGGPADNSAATLPRY